MKFTPAARSLSTMARLGSRAKKRATLWAITGPTPPAAASSSSEAAMMRSRSPMASASTSAPRPPRWRMPRATSRLGRGRVFEASMAASRLLAEMSAKPSSVISFSWVNE